MCPAHHATTSPFEHSRYPSRRCADPGRASAIARARDGFSAMKESHASSRSSKWAVDRERSTRGTWSLQRSRTRSWAPARPQPVLPRRLRATPADRRARMVSPLPIVSHRSRRRPVSTTVCRFRGVRAVGWLGLRHKAIVSLRDWRPSAVASTTMDASRVPEHPVRSAGTSRVSTTRPASCTERRSS